MTSWNLQANVWIQRKNILSEVIQTQKDKYKMYSLRVTFWLRAKKQNNNNNNKNAYRPQFQRNQITEDPRETYMDLHRKMERQYCLSKLRVNWGSQERAERERGGRKGSGEKCITQ